MKVAQWPMPEAAFKTDGSPRRVGVEFELQGIPVDMLARLTAVTLRGSVEKISEAEFDVNVPDQGKYRIEVDFALLKDMARAQMDTEEDEQSTFDRLTLEALSAASSVVVPCEVVSPPIAMQELAEPMDQLIHAIRGAGGKGTKQSPLYAFGVHLNVEPPDLEADTVVAYLKAFVCLFDWIVWHGEVDLTRRATTYIQRYPVDFDIQVTDPAYWPDWESLISDYVQWNPSRNRALDMLPMLSDVDEETVRQSVDDDLVTARPAFHYRLANCQIDEPDWSIEKPWRHWLQVEHLANDRDALDACCVAFRKDRERMFHRVDNSWRNSVTQWLN